MRWSVCFVLSIGLGACSGGGGGPSDAPGGPHQVRVTLMGTGTGTVRSVPAGIACPGTCAMTLAHGKALALVATADAGMTFLGWMGGCTGTDLCVLDVTADAAVTAVFAQDHELVVVPGGNGAGTITSDPPGIECGTDCSELFSPGTLVTLSTTADASSTFTGWGGACSGTGACTVTMDMARMVTGEFTLRQYAVGIVLAGTGDGSVVSSPPGINCGPDCSEVFDHGTQVTLTPTPIASSDFIGWGGACSGTGPCTFTVGAAASATATFDLAYHLLTVQAISYGTGRIVSVPPGTIDCGAFSGTCSATLLQGSTVTLQAQGGAFTGWTAGCTGTATTCTVDMTTDRSVVGQWFPPDAP